MTVLVLIGTVLCDHLRDVPWEDIFKLSASAADSEFCGRVQSVLKCQCLLTKFCLSQGIYIFEVNYSMSVTQVI